jgi:muconolactone delta-isomerase
MGCFGRFDNPSIFGRFLDDGGSATSLGAQPHWTDQRDGRPGPEPSHSGEWRSLGLYAADDAAQLERVLASMPLRNWRTDEVTPLGPHPNDPDQPAAMGGTEFLTTFNTAVPEGTPHAVVDETEAREAQRARELAGQGHLQRLWALPGSSRALGLWRARDTAEMQAIVASLPLANWMTVETTPLVPHPSDPAAASPPAAA